MKEKMIFIFNGGLTFSVLTIWAMISPASFGHWIGVIIDGVTH